MTHLQLVPVDAWFFRDGRPYIEGESNQTDVESVFPPSPRTVAGALRVAAARQLGWSGRGSWADRPDIVDALGDGPDQTGKARFGGICLTFEGEQWFPAPRHLLLARDGDHEPRALMSPGEAVICDLGEVRLLDTVPETRDCADQWISSRGINAVLRGELPNELRTSKDFFELEPRIGIRRNEQTLTTEEGAMYSPHYVRLRPGAALGVRLEGVNVSPTLVPFGGEARLAHLDTFDAASFKAPEDEIRHTRRFIAMFLSPANIIGADHTQPGPGEILPEFEGSRIVSAAIHGWEWIGGWNFKSRSPLPLTPHVPAGSVYFCEADSDAAIEHALSRHDECVGTHANLGFGHVVLGVWPNA